MLKILKQCLRLLITSCLLAVLCIFFIAYWLTLPKQTTIRIEQASGLPVENVTFPSSSGSLIHGWYINGKTHYPHIILLHPRHGNRLTMLPRAKFLYQAGYSVLLFDFQANGESIASQQTLGYLEAYDVAAAINFIKQRVPNTKIGVIATSLGAAALLSIKPSPAKVDAMVLEAVYPSIEQAISNRLALHLGEPAKILTPLFSYQIPLWLGFSTDKLQPIKQITAYQIPIFILAGIYDQHTTIQESRQLFHQIKSKHKYFLALPATHQDFYQYNPKTYELRILQFFRKHLD